MLALGQALVRRGHEVCLQTWTRWREPVEAAGMLFAAAPEYQVFPTRDRPLKPYQAAVRAARETAPLVAELRPDAVVADILTVAMALAGELERAPVATLVPHVFPITDPGFPPYSIGARLPRGALGRAAWRLTDPIVRRGLKQGRRELNETRERLGLAPRPWLHNGISRELCLVGTLPQLEYPREWPGWARVVGPLLWEPPSEPVALPSGDLPLVLVAPSTSQDPGHRLLRAALAGLAGEPVRVLATYNGRDPGPIDVPPNATVVPWLSYARTMPHCALVVCHAGHGTLARALSAGAAVLACPDAGDQSENAARIDWAGVGVRLPRRLVTPWALRLAVRRALADPSMGRRAGALGAWAAANDGAVRASEVLEQWVAGGPTRTR